MPILPEGGLHHRNVPSLTSSSVYRKHEIPFPTGTDEEKWRDFYTQSRFSPPNRTSHPILSNHQTTTPTTENYGLPAVSCHPREKRQTRKRKGKEETEQLLRVETNPRDGRRQHPNGIIRSIPVGLLLSSVACHPRRQKKKKRTVRGCASSHIAPCRAKLMYISYAQTITACVDLGGERRHDRDDKIRVRTPNLPHSRG